MYKIRTDDTGKRTVYTVENASGEILLRTHSKAIAQRYKNSLERD